MSAIYIQWKLLIPKMPSMIIYVLDYTKVFFYIKCQGFKNKTIVGFKPLRGPFSQFQYLLSKYMGNLTIELKLVTNATDCFNYRRQNFKRFKENSSRLELSENSRGTRPPKLEQARMFKKNLNSVIYEALGSHSHGFRVF